MDHRKEEKQTNQSINPRNSSLREFESINSFNVLDNYETCKFIRMMLTRYAGMNELTNYNATIKNRVYVNKFPEQDALMKLKIML